MRTQENDFAMTLDETLDLIQAIPDSDSDMRDYYKRRYNERIKEVAKEIINVFTIYDWQKMNSAADIKAHLDTATQSRANADIAAEIADIMFIEQK